MFDRISSNIRETILTSRLRTHYLFIKTHYVNSGRTLCTHHSPAKRSKFEIHLVRFIRFELYL